eukprot:TRINITY_DN4984_c0_g1_i3.p1 TRINITY_DN4984_c0_g1~~TRINITY_DN4984_c0_g1_i3.p1  ORF type:complete len:246 (-),score=-15.81 TRINITY_DN4984_c0_g1_i3:10-747(-)
MLIFRQQFQIGYRILQYIIKFHLKYCTNNSKVLQIYLHCQGIKCLQRQFYIRFTYVVVISIQCIITTVERSNLFIIKRDSSTYIAIAYILRIIALIYSVLLRMFQQIQLLHIFSVQLRQLSALVYLYILASGFIIQLIPTYFWIGTLVVVRVEKQRWLIYRLVSFSRYLFVNGKGVLIRTMQRWIRNSQEQIKKRIKGDKFFPPLFYPLLFLNVQTWRGEAEMSNCLQNWQTRVLERGVEFLVQR